MRTELFDYYLPPELIAQKPAEPRDSSRLLVLPPDGPPRHAVFRDLPEFLAAGDLLVLNRTRVIRARLVGRKVPTGGEVEVLLLRPAPGLNPASAAAWSEVPVWEALVRPGRRVGAGTRLVFGDAGGTAGPGGPESGPEGPVPRLTAEVLARTASGGRIVAFRPERPGETVGSALEALGRVPLPPYVKRPLDDEERYQTVFATDAGSVAAPTAGLHFTEDVFRRLAAEGVTTTRLTLHIGLDTFRPVREAEVEAHRMHSEWFEVPVEAARAVEDCRRRGGRVVACGTTVVRTLESAADPDAPGLVRSGSGETSLFIYPGFSFRVVDVLLTNFHLPRSTLLMLVSAFAGRERVLAAYEEARRMGYRFYSFGDAMLAFRPDGGRHPRGGPGGEGRGAR